MKRILCLLGLMLSFSFILLGTNLSQRVYDSARLFTKSERTILENQIKQLQQNYDMDVIIVTTNDARGKTSQDYADDFYDKNGFGFNNTRDGLLLLIDMDNRNVYISTSGEAIPIFTDARINEMVNHLVSFMKDGVYSKAAYAFTEDCDIYLEAGAPIESEFYEDNYGPISKTGRTPLQAGGLALIIALGATVLSHVLVTNRYTNPKHVNPPMYPLDVQYTQRSDRFVTSHTSRRYIPPNNNNRSGGSFGGGGSSTHTSSSGNTHGGGGGSF